MICVFDVIEGPARGKRFWLRENQRIAVGRISTADFAVPADPHMSRHHLIFEASPKILRVRDVGSSNGTYVNNSRVTKLELCPGDHVRAGSTTFEVTLLGDDQDPHGRDGIPLDSLRAGSMLSTTESNSAVMPNFSADQVEPASAAPSINLVPTLKFAEEAQRTGSASVTSSESVSGPVNESPPSGAPVAPVNVSVRVIQYGSQALQPPVPPKPEVNPALANMTDDVLTMRADPAWWAAYFQVSPTPFVMEQRPGHKAELGEVLKRAQTLCPLALVVNHSQLNSATLQFYATAINPKLITRLSQSLSLVRCDDSDNLWNLVRMSARHDAIICLAARMTFEANWLVELLNCLSYPSMLSSLAEAGKSNVTKRLLKHAQFAIYEKNRSGELGLMID